MLSQLEKRTVFPLSVQQNEKLSRIFLWFCYVFLIFILILFVYVETHRKQLYVKPVVKKATVGLNYKFPIWHPKMPKKDYKVKLYEVVATAYAPLDPKAVRGMCYSGNPKVTASGNTTTPGLTIATPRNLPFGTWVYLDKLGWRQVHDRGGSIKGNRIDICFQTRKEAFAWGRRKIKMYVFYEKE